MVACEARRIEAEAAATATREDRRVDASLVPYLFRGGGEGQPIDELVAVSSDDRWIVVYRDEQLVLVDDAGGRETTLITSRVPATRDGFHRVAVFDGDSSHVVYFRVEKGGSTLVTRDLATQRERQVWIANERVRRIVPEPVGHWVRVLFAREGEPEYDRRYGPPPSGWAWPPGPRCTIDSTARYWMFGLPGAQAWHDLATGDLHRDPRVLAHLGELVIRRMPDKAIKVGDQEMIPASCDATVQAVSTQPLRIVATCAAATPDVPMEIFGPGIHAQIGQVPYVSERSVKFVDRAYACPRTRVCFSIRDGGLVSMYGGTVVAVGDHVLARGEKGMFFATGPNRLMPVFTTGGSQNWSAGGIRAVGTLIVDVDGARVLGDAERDPLAVDTAGRALVPASFGSDLQRWDIGPLRWVSPKPRHPSP